MLGFLKKMKNQKTKNNTTVENNDNIKVTCPECNVNYEVQDVKMEPVQCQDCGCEYMQMTNSNKVFDWVREKIKTVGGC